MLKEAEIRPDELMAAQELAYEQDVAWLAERRHGFVSVACPACDADLSDLQFEKYGQRFVRCRSCSTVYITPRPPPKMLEEYYASSKNYAYWSKEIFPASEAVRREKIFVPRVDRLLEICDRLGSGRGTILEVGAGFGIFCEEMSRRSAFRRIIAIEPTPDLADHCRSRGLEVIEKPVAAVTLEPGSIDVLASFEVIEHLFSPREFLEHARKLLVPGKGILVLTCPNVEGFDVSLLGKVSSTFSADHLNYFHPASLSHLLDSLGFDVLEAQTPGELDAELVHKAIASGEYSSECPFLDRVLVDEWARLGGPFQQFLLQNLLSSNMWLVARRRVGT